MFRQMLTLFMLTVALFVAAPSAWAQSEMDQAMGLFYQEKWDEAIPLFDAVIKKEPENTLALAYLLHAYYKKKDITSIINRYEQAAVAGGDATTQAQLGMAYFLKGLVIPNILEEALTEFKSALKDDPRCSVAYTGTGMVYFQKRMMPRAKGFFVRALRINPNDIMALDRLGNIMLVDEKKPGEALELYQRIVELLPSYPDGQYYVGSALFDLKRYDEAVPYLQKARDMDPKGITQGFDAATLLGDTLLHLQRNTEAISAFEMALKMNPESKYAQFKLEKAKHPEKDITPETPDDPKSNNS